ncbi:hypothetical protein NECAME_12284 [Necator americanus]|uniref:Uncharacterized protein n=1 Tax=Necator americanus TaxID=51031 RepID=W2T110_NECAM|nr:hypothetical protein NECAME_12284 [Necator americanus]ETN75583.1 hypothetical protein NECAME_12284 [Necator americanus]
MELLVPILIVKEEEAELLESTLYVVVCARAGKALCEGCRDTTTELMLLLL